MNEEESWCGDLKLDLSDICFSVSARNDWTLSLRLSSILCVILVESRGFFFRLLLLPEEYSDEDDEEDEELPLLSLSLSNTLDLSEHELSDFKSSSVAFYFFI